MIDDRRIGLISAGVAFFAMFAIFPAVAAVIALWGFFSDPLVVVAQLETARGFLPAAAYDVLERQILALIEANDSTLGWATLVSFAVAFWSARAGVAAIVQGINAIFSVPNRAGFGHLVQSLIMTLALIGVALVALTAVIVLPLVLAFAPLGPFEAQLIQLVKWSVSPLVVIFGIGLVYRFGPNLHRRRQGWLTPGLALALLLWLGASSGLSVYLTNFGNYNEVYGSIGAVIALLMWFYLSAYAVLLGAALNAALIEMRNAPAQ